MEHLSQPSYYMMNESQDIFAWLETLPQPDLPDDTALQAIVLWATGFRYARRCLWKEDVIREKGRDARKAATCFLRLAELCEHKADEQRAHGDELERLIGQGQRSTHDT